MKIASWNVNSLNVRLAHVLDWLAQAQPDVLALQETKMTDDKFPAEVIEQAGYYVRFSGQKTYNGVAIISKSEAADVCLGIPGLDDEQKRMIAATFGGVRVINCYVPNGQEVGSEKYAYKFRWLEALLAYLAAELARHERLLVLGDINIAPADIDVHNPSRWLGSIMCSQAERDMFQCILDLGLNDAMRLLQPETQFYTWWDYRLKAFERGWGLRIDHILTSDTLTPRAGGMDTDMRARERPSDHVPVWIEVV
ncbi:MAG: exodeoxyribonuclease III [Mariprofundaceae bacterium]